MTVFVGSKIQISSSNQNGGLVDKTGRSFGSQTKAIADNSFSPMAREPWLGHADKTITDRYVKMQGRIKERQTWAEKTALGFKLPKALQAIKGGKAA